MKMKLYKTTPTRSLKQEEYTYATDFRLKQQQYLTVRRVQNKMITSDVENEKNTEEDIIGM